MHGKQRNRLKTPEHVTSVLHIILIRMHGRDTATEKEFDAILQMTPEHVLTQRFKQSNKWTTKVTNISKHLPIF